MIPFKVRKKNDHVKNNIYTVYDIDHFRALTGDDTKFLVYAKGSWQWILAKEYEPVEEYDKNGST